MFGEQSYSSFVVEKFIVGTSGQYNDMMARPYFMHTGESSLDELMLKTQNGLNITQNSVQLEAQSIVQVSAEGHGKIAIDGGWQADRNVFMMIVVNKHNGAKFILSGYTSADAAVGGAMDGYASLFFNSVVELAAITNYDGTVSYKLHNADNILTSTHLSGGIADQAITSAQRPSDVLSNALLRMETIDGSSSDINRDTPIVHLGMVDSMGTGSRSPELSRANNSSASDYLFRTARAFSDSCLTGSGVDDLTHQLEGTINSSIISEGAYQELPLINTILQHASSRRGANCTYNELRQVMPDIDSVIQIIPNDTGVSTNGTEHWEGRGHVVIAAELGAAIPALMLKLGMASAGFQMSMANAYDTMDSYPNTFNFKANPAVGGAMLAFISPDIPQQEMVATFESYLRTVIFPTACKGRHVVLDIECTTMKSLTISISIDGSHPYTRTAPTFGSSSWNPVSATTLEANTSMSNGMLDLTSYMVNSQQGNAQPGTSYVETTQQGTSDPLDNDLF